MPTIVTENGRIEVPKERPRGGDKPDFSNHIYVKVSGWVKYQKDGRIAHIPPHEVLRIEENDPDTKQGHNGNDTGIPESNVTYQNPHGRV